MHVTSAFAIFIKASAEFQLRTATDCQRAKYLRRFFHYPARNMKFSAIIVVVTAIVALSSANAVPGSHSKRQSGCPPPAVTTQCAQALAAYTLAFGTSIVPGTSSPSAMNRAAIADSLDTICGTCFDNFRATFRCANQGEAHFVSGICGRIGGESNTRCPLAIVDRIDADTPAIPSATTCGVGSCSSDCEDTLNQIRTDLGCCAASFYNTTGSPLAAVGMRYETCNINLGAVCSGAAGLIYLSATLLVAIAAIAASIL